MKLPLPKRKARAAEIDRRGTQVVPAGEPATPPPAPIPLPDAPCGACDVPRGVHGVRYAHEVGHHEWIRAERVRIPRSIGDL